MSPTDNSPSNDSNSNSNNNNNPASASSGGKRSTASIRAPKVGHKKSRKGCQTCKARRVKCDETLPVCGICLRLGLECTYTTPEPPRVRAKSQTAASPFGSKTSPGGPSSQSGSAAFNFNSPDADSSVASPAPRSFDPDVGETRQRRYMELRLLHHWMINVSRPFGLTAPPVWKELWHGEVPSVALHNENALFAMFAMSATHLLSSHPNDDSILQARQNYWVQALREQRNAVSNLADPNMDVSKTDAVAYAALLITMNALAMLQERSFDPYVPPMDWLEVGRGAFTVLPPYEQVADGSGLKVLMDTTAPIWTANIEFGADMQREFGSVLNRDIPSTDIWDQETCESYEAALSYIGSFRRNLLMGQTADVSLRWICMFPFMVPRKFIDFIAEQRPRALVTLAYFFAIVARADALRYLGNTGAITLAHKEIFAIRKILPREWQALMDWPLKEIGAG